MILTNKEFSESCTVEIGISDQQHLVGAILKSDFIKRNQKTKFYQDHKKFEIEKFKTELYSNIDKKEVYCYSSFD